MFFFSDIDHSDFGMSIVLNQCEDKNYCNNKLTDLLNQPVNKRLLKHRDIGCCLKSTCKLMFAVPWCNRYILPLRRLRNFDVSIHLRCTFIYLDFLSRTFAITGAQGKGQAVSMTPAFHFHPFHRHLDINRVITAESSPLHKASSRTQIENLRFPSTSY